MLKENGFEYLSVTRSKLKNYTIINPSQPTVELQDNRGNKINVEFVTKKPSKKVEDRKMMTILSYTFEAIKKR